VADDTPHFGSLNPAIIALPWLRLVGVAGSEVGVAGLGLGLKHCPVVLLDRCKQRQEEQGDVCVGME
jgi:hypothetical protein